MHGARDACVGWHLRGMWEKLGVHQDSLSPMGGPRENCTVETCLVLLPPGQLAFFLAELQTS